MKARLSSFVLVVLFAAAVAAFWFLEGTTAERIGSLVFFVLVTAYALGTHRPDVLAAVTLFFTMIDLNQYIFLHYLPYWVSMIAVLSAMLLLWAILFGNHGWFMAVAGSLAVLELIFALQFTNLTLFMQAMVVVAPFIVLSQYYYFQLHRPNQ